MYFPRCLARRASMLNFDGPHFPTNRVRPEVAVNTSKVLNTSLLSSSSILKAPPSLTLHPLFHSFQMLWVERIEGIRRETGDPLGAFFFHSTLFTDRVFSFFFRCSDIMNVQRVGSEPASPLRPPLDVTTHPFTSLLSTHPSLPLPMAKQWSSMPNVGRQHPTWVNDGSMCVIDTQP